MFNLVRLFNPNADTDTVHTRFDEDFLIFVTRDGKRVEKEFRRALGLNFRYIMSLGRLGSEVRNSKRGGERGSDALEIWTQRLRLQLLAINC